MHVISNFKLVSNQPVYSSTSCTGNTVTRRARAQNYTVQYTISGTTADVQSFVNALTGTNKIDLGLVNPHPVLPGLHVPQMYTAGTTAVQILDANGLALNPSVMYYIQFSGHNKIYTYQNGLLNPSLRLPVQISESCSTRPELHYTVTSQKTEFESNEIQEVKIEGTEQW